MSSKDYFEAFREAVGKQESGGRYDVENSLGYLGKYQFGMARLTDMGIAERIPGTKGYGNKSFRFKEGHSKEAFLADTELQEELFSKHTREIAAYVDKHHSDKIGMVIDGVPVTRSGAVAVVHLLGRGGLQDLFKGEVKEDAFGTKATRYLAQFAGHVIDGKGGEAVDLSQYTGPLSGANQGRNPDGSVKAGSSPALSSKKAGSSPAPLPNMATATRHGDNVLPTPMPPGTSVNSGVMADILANRENDLAQLRMLNQDLGGASDLMSWVEKVSKEGSGT